MNLFIDRTHEQRYQELLARDGLSGKNDIERGALFFIIAGNAELFGCVSGIYNFRYHRLRTDIWNHMDGICISGTNLLKLGINLYNGNIMADMDPYKLLRFLDPQNLQLALNAMYLRFA